MGISTRIPTVQQYFHNIYIVDKLVFIHEIYYGRIVDGKVNGVAENVGYNKKNRLQQYTQLKIPRVSLHLQW